MKKNNKKGFTLAELLIVVAIIAVLVAIAIPIFNSQLEKAREATDLANLRAAYAECSAAVLSGEGTTGSGTALSNGVTVTQTDGNYTATKTVTLKQKKAKWQTGDVEIGGIVLDKETLTIANVVVTVEDDGDEATFKQGATDLKKTT